MLNPDHPEKLPRECKFTRFGVDVPENRLTPLSGPHEAATVPSRPGSPVPCQRPVIPAIGSARWLFTFQLSDTVQPQLWVEQSEFFIVFKDWNVKVKPDKIIRVLGKIARSEGLTFSDRQPYQTLQKADPVGAAYLLNMVSNRDCNNR